jgi:hypothetical protein
MNRNKHHYENISSLRDIHREMGILRTIIDDKENVIRNDVNDIKESFNVFSILKSVIRKATPYISMGFSAAGLMSKIFFNKKS